MALTYEEVKALPHGTMVLVNWSGCNKPQPYKLHQRGQWGPWPAAVDAEGMFADHISAADVVTILTALGAPDNREAEASGPHGD